MAAMHEDLCPYSIYSLQFYLVFPLIKTGQFLNLPPFLSFILALILPAILLINFIKIATTTSGHVTLVKHSPRPDHPHSSAITLAVITRSAILGVLLTVGLSLIASQLDQVNHLMPLGIYLVLLSFFHFSEYFATSLTNPSTLNPSSFLLDNSTAYILAISGSFLEFTIETFLFPGFKRFNYFALFGLVLAIGGEIIRKTAMFTAGKNFTHLISSKKDPEHRLVTKGIYSLLRHPSYAGWLYWAVGSQILLLNPICTIAFFIMSYKFFKDRIQYEESTLIDFFGNEYALYRKRVGLWMPIQL